MRVLARDALRTFFLLATLVLATPSAADFAPEGTEGVLEVDVVVEGAGSEKAGSGAGLESRSWSVEHRATYRLTMVAQPPLTGEGPDDSTDDPGDDDAWEKKIEACQGDPTCEMALAMERMNDPRIQQQMQRIGEMGSAAMTGAGGAPSGQVWRLTTRSGHVRVVDRDDAHGVVSEAGGLVDVLCTRSLDDALSPSPPVSTAPVPAVLTIDAARSTYTLHLPVEERFALKKLCTSGGEPYEESQRGSSPLLGDRPSDRSSWSSVLTVQGSITGGPAAPTFDGSKELEADVLGSPDRRAKVKIGWRFRPGNG